MCRNNSTCTHSFFFPWKIAGLYEASGRDPRLLRRDLGTLHRNQLSLTPPTFQTCKLFPRKLEASRRSQGQRHPPCLSARMCQDSCSCQSHHLKLVQDHITLQLKRLHFVFVLFFLSDPYSSCSPSDLAWLKLLHSFPLAGHKLAHTHDYP